jgi:hypothetical protein
MKRERELTFERFYLGKPILQFTTQNVGLDENILFKIYQVYDQMFTRHKRVYAMRFDMRLPENVDTSDNSAFRSFMAYFIQAERRYGYDPMYCAVREESETKGVHYHILLLLNGDKTRKSFYHIELANRIFNKKFGYPPRKYTGMINDCTQDGYGRKHPNGYLIDRDAYYQCESNENSSFRQASYLAKASQKNQERRMRELFSSRLRYLNEQALGGYKNHVAPKKR